MKNTITVQGKEYKATAIDPFTIEVIVNGTSIVGSNKQTLTSNILDFLNKNIERPVIDLMDFLTEVENKEIDRAIEITAKNFKVDDCIIDTIWMDYITIN